MKTLVKNISTLLSAGSAVLLMGLAASCNEAKDSPAAAWLIGLAGGTVTQQAVPNDPTDLFDDPVISDPLNNVEFSIDLQTQSGNEKFLFESNKTVEFIVDIKTAATPAGGALFRIMQFPNGGQVIYQAIADENGNIRGNFTIDRDAKSVYLEAEYKGQRYTKEINISAVVVFTAQIRFQATSTDYTFKDRDADGVRDFLDAYPDDPNRAALIRIPEDGGYYTVAYEDLYPKPGDMDFNDMVVRVRYEQDLNAAGKAVRMRIFYQHIAKGAGYNHILYQKIPGIREADLTFERYGYPVNGELPVEYSENRRITGTDAVHIFSSKESIAVSNTNAGGVYAGGKQAKAEYVFLAPAALTELGKAPFDLYLYVINTKHEIHFAGLGYKKTDGSEKYLDANGFPWALMLPGKWYWPYETGDIHAAYPAFAQWYMSYGADARDWYKNPVAEKVFPY